MYYFAELYKFKKTPMGTELFPSQRFEYNTLDEALRAFIRYDSTKVLGFDMVDHISLFLSYNNFSIGFELFYNGQMQLTMNSEVQVYIEPRVKSEERPARGSDRRYAMIEMLKLAKCRKQPDRFPYTKSYHRSIDALITKISCLLLYPKLAERE